MNCTLALYLSYVVIDCWLSYFLLSFSAQEKAEVKIDFEVTNVSCTIKQYLSWFRSCLYLVEGYSAFFLSCIKGEGHRLVLVWVQSWIGLLLRAAARETVTSGMDDHEIFLGWWQFLIGGTERQFRLSSVFGVHPKPVGKCELMSVCWSPVWGTQGQDSKVGQRSNVLSLSSLLSWNRNRT